MNSPAITVQTIEEAPQRLWLEFLGGYFDGEVHQVAGSGVSFPDVWFSDDDGEHARIAFDQGDLPQPLGGLGITVVCETVNERSYLREEGERSFDDVAWTFYVRAQAARGGEGNSRHICRQGAQALYALLKDKEATLPLAQRGLMQLRPRKPQVVIGTDFAVRSLRCRGQLQYHFEFSQ